MKKIINILMVVVMLTILCSCGVEEKVINVNVENAENTYDTIFGKDALIKIGGGLYYDSSTRIVYMVNGIDGTYESKTYCPYYAPNGLPYRYNPTLNTFEEIE